MTWGVAGSAPGQDTADAVTSESVTVTFARNEVPVLVTTKETATCEPAGTETPGAVLASSSLSDLTMVTPLVAGV